MKHPVVQPEHPDSSPLSRRRLLKALAVAGGATAASTLLPGKWLKPDIGVGVLPVHAQVTGPVEPDLGTGDIQVTLRWNTGDVSGDCSSGNANAVDIDLWVQEPDGTYVNWSNTSGPTATLDVDNQAGFGPENTYVPTGIAVNGHYKVWIVYYCGTGTTVATITIRLFANTPQEATHVFERTLEAADDCTAYWVAEISWPDGAVTDLTGPYNVCVETQSGLTGK